MPHAPVERLGQARARWSRRAASRSRAPGRPRGTPRAARCSRSRRRGRASRPSRARRARGRRGRAARRAARAAHVDPHALAALAAQGGELVEQPGLGAGPVVLDARAEAGERDSVGGRARRRPRRARGRAPRTGRRTRTGPLRAAGRREIVRRQRAHLDALASQLRRRAAHQQPPALGGASFRAKFEAVALAEIAARGLDRVPCSGLGGDRDASLDREREAEAVVVVGVLADQVDPPRGERLDTPPFAGEACSRRVFEWRIGEVDPRVIR